MATAPSCVSSALPLVIEIIGVALPVPPSNSLSNSYVIPISNAVGTAVTLLLLVFEVVTVPISLTTSVLLGV